MHPCSWQAVPKGSTFHEDLRSLGAGLAGFLKEKYEWEWCVHENFCLQYLFLWMLTTCLSFLGGIPFGVQFDSSERDPAAGGHQSVFELPVS